MKAIKRLVSAEGVIWSALVGVLLLLIKYPEETAALVTRGLEICARSLIPALFPFSVLGALLCSVRPPSFISSFISRLFGVSPSGACAVISGYLSGFPVGALCTSRLYKEGRITKGEAERLICFINNPSAPFVIGVVGRGVLGDTGSGVTLYLILTLVSVLTGVVLGRSAKRETLGECVDEKEAEKGISFSEAVASSALSMLGISATVVLFSVIGGYLSMIAKPLGTALSSLVCGLMELTNGVSMLAHGALSEELRFLLCSVLCAFSGISVHMQISSALRGTDIRMRLYFITRLTSSIAVAAVCMIINLL